MEVSEGVGTAEIWVDLTSILPVPRQVEVDYEILEGSTAIDGEDFTASVGTLVFSPGETSKAVEVPILQDNLAEYTERFSVELKNPVFADLEDGATTLTAEVVIEDDEPFVTMEAVAAAVNEGTDAVFNLTRRRNTSDELGVYVQVSWDATYRETVIFPAGHATTKLAVPTEDDTTLQGSRTITALIIAPHTIAEPRTYLREGTFIQSITVLDDELPGVRLHSEKARVIEGEPVKFKISRSAVEGYHRGRLTVSLSVDAPADYTSGSMPTSATIPVGARSVEVEIPTVDDTVDEDTGELTVTVLDGAGYRPEYPNTYTFLIFDDDGSPYGVQVNASKTWVDEGEDVIFNVTRSGLVHDPLDARLRLHRIRSRVTAADLSDPTLGVTTPQDHILYDDEEITVSFPAGTSALTVTRSTTDDSLNYGNSTYHATVLAGPDDVYAAHYEHTASVWVQDDDRPTVTVTAPVTEFYANPGQVYPGVGYESQPGNRSVTLTRTGDTSGAIRITAWTPYTVYWPAPEQDEHISAPSNNVRDIPPGQTSSAIQFHVLNYAGALGRSVTYRLTAPHNCPDDPEACGYGPQYTLGTPQEATLRVYNNFMGVRVEADQTTVAEGGTAVFTLHRHGGKPDAMTRPLHVNVEVTQSGDYISGATPGTVTFLAGQATATLSVPTNNDSTDERNGAITANILPATNFEGDEYAYIVAQYAGTPWVIYSATTAVTDDDNPLPNLSISDYEVDEEQGTFIFTMSLDAPNYQDPVSFDWTTRDDGSATEGVDYEATASSFTFAPGVTRLLSGIVITSDTVPEPDETFSIVLSNLTNAVPGDTTGTVTIRDDELDYGVTMFGTPGEFVEGEEVAFTLRRIPSIPASEFSSHILPSYPCFQAVRCLDLNAAPGNKALTLNLEVTQVGDFASQALPATVTFAPGERFAIVRIPTDDDSQTEPAGAITVRILSGSGYTTEFFGTRATATANILDNDLAISIDDAQADESAGQMDFTVKLSAPAPRRVTVNAATVDGDATSHSNVTATSLGRDFEAKSETITFEVGEQQKTFSVNLVDDSIQEMDETFSVVLSDPSQGSGLAAAAGAIVDDEQPMVASVSRTYSIVDEDHAGAVSFMVTLSHATTTASERHPAVDWQAVAGTATEGDDYQAAEGRLVFPVGMTSGSVQVDLIDDNLFEGELETFSVELIEQGRRLLTLSPTDASYEVSIRDNEILTAAITSNAEYVAEGGEAVFTVKLAGGVTTEDVQITFETGGDAQAGDDYGPPTGNIIFPPGNTTGSAGSLTIPAGLSSGTIAYLVFTDTVEEEDGETLEVQLFTVFDGLRGSGSGVSTTQNKASTNILDEDSLTVSIEGTPTVTEGGAATFTITLSTASEETVTVGWQTNQAGDTLEAGETAEPDKDYTAASGDLAIQAGDTSGTITVQTTQDTLVEDTETFVVTVEEATQGTGTPPELVLLGADSTTGTITDDDTAPDGLIMSVSPPMLTEASGSVDIPVTVTLDGTAQFTTDIPVTIEFVNRPNVLTNATLGEDYTANTVNTVILAGSSSVTATITITPVEDSIAEDDEIARLVAKSTALTGSDGMGIAIEDNDTEPVEVVLTVSPDTLYETSGSTPLNVTASLVGQASRRVDTVVTVTPGSGTATLGEDFESATLTLTIPTGEMSAAGTLVFTVTDDTIHEGDETLHISASVPGLAVTAADVTIKDDDPAPTSIGLSVTAVPISEGGGAVTLPVQAILLGGGTRAEDTTVDLRLVDLTATLTDDYTAAWGTTALTIPAGEFSGHTTLTITPVQDTLHEESETVAVRGRNTDPGLSVNGVRLTIGDDDPAPATIKLDIAEDSVSEGVGVTWLQVTATLEGNSTLLEDVRINTELASTTSNTRSFGGSLVSPLIIAAGESSASSEIAITNLNDDVDDSDETLELRGTASDPSLSVLPDQVVITDDDTFGVTIWPSSLSVREGRRQNYNISLNSEPTSDVTVTVDLPADAGFTVNPGVLTFSPQSWGTKYVYVRTTEDEDAADEPAAIITHTITSADTLYRDASAGSVSVTVRDDETAEVTVSKAALEIEEGASDTYTVVLDTEPAGDVTVTIEGVADTDVSLDKTVLTFTDQDWDAAQTVTVTAEHDGDAVDEAVVTITHTVSSTADSAYDGVTADSVAVTITDDDSVGVTVSKAALEIEEGASDTYTVVLDTEPAGEVTVTIEGVADTDVSLDKTVLTFTDQDWDAAQTVTVTAEHDDDAVDEAVVTITHTVSSTADSAYDGVTADSVAVTITDDDSVGVTISKASLEIEEGASDTYTVVLDTEPAGEVTVTIEGVADTDVSLDKTVLTFSDQDWDAAQTVTVTAEHDGDAVDEAVVTITHTVSSTDDSTYQGVTADSVAVTITDDDSVGVTVSKAALEIEEGASDTYTVVLDTEPAGEVTVTIEGVADTDVSLDKTVLTFTDQDWDAPQTVTVTAEHDEDAVDEAVVTITHTVSSTDDSTYQGVTADSVNVTLTDDDSVGVTISKAALEIEEGASDTYTVVLDTEPAGEVTVTIEGVADTDVSLDKTVLTFTDQDWDAAQTVTVTAEHDGDAVDEAVVTITHTVSSTDDSTYQGVTADSVAVTITDDDSVGVTVSKASLEIEEGASDTYTVVLDTEPAGEVKVAIGGVADTDVSLDKTVLTFSDQDWDTAQTVTVTAEHDGDAVDEAVVTITHTVSSTDDSTYQGVTADSVNVTLTDDDSVGVTISKASLEIEEGASDTYTVVLDTEPAGEVTVTIGGVADTDVSLDKTILTFTDQDWDTAQTVTVTAEHDEDAVDEAVVTITHTVSSTADSTYQGVTADSVAVTITDDDSVGVTISKAALEIEEGSSDTYTVVLDTEPAGDVTVTIGGVADTDVSLDKTVLTFTDQDWDTAQTVTVTAEHDGDAVDEAAVTITHTVSSTADSTYQGVTADSVAVTITDDDSVGVTVSKASLEIEEGASDTYTVVLDTEPAGDVTVTIGGVADTDVSLDKTVLTFSDQDWDTAQTVSVTAEHDGDAVDEAVVTITHTVNSTADTDYDGVTAAGVAVTATDDDSVGVTVSKAALEIEEGASDSYTVVLDTEPAGDVTVTIGGVADTDVSLDKTILTFTDQDWDTPQTVTVTAEHDDDAVDEAVVTITHTVSSTDDTDYDGLTAAGVAVTITDDAPETVTVSFEQGSYTVAEGSSVTVKVQLDADPERTVTIPLTKAGQGGATSADYSGVPANVVFNAGDTEKTFSVTATDDSDNDDGESVKLAFDTLPAGVTEGSTKEAVVSITDDDVPAVTVSFEQGSYTVAEGSSVTVKVQLDADPERTVTIPLTKAGQGGATSADYSGVPASVVFNAGDTEKTFSVTATDDSDNDDGESVKLAFDTLPAGVTEGSTKEAVVSITDDDVPAVTVSFEQGSYTVAEGSSVTVKVQLDADPERTVTIPLTEEGQDGASGADYSGVPANVVFNASDTEKSITFTATADDDNDDGESVKLAFGSPLPAGVTEGSTKEAVVSITDDDVPAVTVSFEQGSYTVAEGSSVTVKVTLSEDPERTVTILLTKANQDGASSADYSGVPANVVFNASDTEKSITFTATADDDNDDGESVKLAFGSPLPAGVTEGSTKEAVVSITDDDVPAVTVSFEQGSYTVAEGSSVTVKVTLSEDPERTVTIPLTKANQDGASSADYSGVPANVVFNASDTEKSFTFTATADDDNDDGESVKLTFGSPLPAGVTEGSTKEAVVSITDDDVPAVTVSFEQGSYTVAEGSSVTVKVTLSEDPERTVTILLTKNGQGGATSADYSGVPANVVFNASDTEKTFTFTATADDDNDDGESVKLTFGSPLPVGVTEGSTKEAVVSITDDDVLLFTGLN